MNDLEDSSHRSRLSGGAFRVLLEIMDKLRESNIYFELSSNGQPDAVLIQVAVPGARWEIEVFENGEVEFEIFSGGGHILGRDELWRKIEEQKDVDTR